jgi:hypothetical protein
MEYRRESYTALRVERLRREKDYKVIKTAYVQVLLICAFISYELFVRMSDCYYSMLASKSSIGSALRHFVCKYT